MSLADLLNSHPLKVFKFEWKWNENKNKDDLSNTTNAATKLCKIWGLQEKLFSAYASKNCNLGMGDSRCWWALPTQSSSPPPPEAFAMPSCPSSMLALQWQPSGSNCTQSSSNVPNQRPPRNTVPYLCAPGLLFTAKGQSCCSSKHAADVEAVEGEAKTWKLEVLWESCCSWNWEKGAEHPQSHSSNRRLYKIEASAHASISPSPPGKFGPMLSLKPPVFLYTAFLTHYKKKKM